jgi:hypothetical protein
MPRRLSMRRMVNISGRGEKGTGRREGRGSLGGGEKDGEENGGEGENK